MWETNFPFTWSWLWRVLAPANLLILLLFGWKIGNACIIISHNSYVFPSFELRLKTNKQTWNVFSTCHLSLTKKKKKRFVISRNTNSCCCFCCCCCCCCCFFFFFFFFWGGPIYVLKNCFQANNINWKRHSPDKFLVHVWERIMQLYTTYLGIFLRILLLFFNSLVLLAKSKWFNFFKMNLNYPLEF